MVKEQGRRRPGLVHCMLAMRKCMQLLIQPTERGNAASRCLHAMHATNATQCKVSIPLRDSCFSGCR